ncbi:MAG: TAT-variant-translocated molybdopterin oxidoreductase [Saprospiraceae bacterium]|nr:TAT-variant-translocated molybdopterin oxidoreductase [Saprospiraceae bacterium]
MKQPSKEMWVSAQDLRNDPELLAAANREFPETSIVEDLGKEGTMDRLESSRRDFLKFLGFSLGAATVAASCEIPVKKAIPYVIKPDSIVPGVASYYASAYVDGGDFLPVLVKTREGRPIKIEGNAISPMTGGGTSARAQASVLSLYDTNRLQSAGKVENGQVAAMSWDDLDKEVKASLTKGGAIRLLSRTVISPSAQAAIAAFSAKYPNTSWIQYDPISCSALLDAQEMSYGVRALPSYHFDAAEVIVSFDADFLGTWISPVEYARAYSTGRKVKNTKSVRMSRHYQVESFMSMTGSNADHRIMVKPSEQGAAIAALYNAVASANGAATINAPALNDKAKKAMTRVAADLMKAAGKGLVVCGVNNLAEQVLVAKINALLGNDGTTVTQNDNSFQRQGSDKNLTGLINEMNSGAVGTLIVLDGNPAFDHAQSEAFRKAMAKVGTRIACAGTLEETGALSTHVAPTTHLLESWGDAYPKKGQFYLIQPTIAPLFPVRQWELSLLVWAESAELDNTSDQPYYEFVKKNWERSVYPSQSGGKSFNSFWESSLHDGMLLVSSAPSAGSNSADVSSVASGLTRPSDGEEIQFFESINMGAGQFAGNPWLQELSDPITRCVWGNYLFVPIGWDGGNDYTFFKGLEDGDRVNLEINGISRTVTIVHQFGLMPGTYAIALGYGRQTVGKAGRDIGTNVQDFLTVNKNGYASSYAVAPVVSGKVGRDKEFACVQHHHTMGVTGADPKTGKTINVDEKTVATIGEGYQGSLVDRSIIFRGNLAELDQLEEKIHEKREEFQNLNDKTLYPSYDDVYAMGHHWGMHIDLNACIGCSACTVACMAENNVPVVGKKEVFRHHEMSWLRIDRYFYGELENPNVVYQPMMCQHCDNAPCENVCPVSATNHSSEGLNQMAYNRCIGTRYCANNCPYKVRRFNWLDYTTADLFPANEPRLNGEEMPFGADNLTRMVLNPDVTVRSRGVMEKCSFCVQRIQEGKLTAKREGRILRDGDVKSACMTACPTDAITFGDLNNKESQLNKDLESPLVYQVLEEVNTRPSVNYRARVLNRDESLES